MNYQDADAVAPSFLRKCPYLLLIKGQ